MGRKPGKGTFSGGRPEGSPNKKGSFDAKLPPVRCSAELEQWVQQQAKESEMRVSAFLREILDAMYNKAHAADKEPRNVPYRRQ